MKPKVLITGGSGLLALNWARCIRAEWDVILGMHTRQVALDGTLSLPVDLREIDSLTRVLEKIKPDLVIHTVALTDVDRCEREPDLAHHINAELAHNVAQACSRLGIKLVHISTDHLFDGKKAFCTELDAVCPVNIYGKTKAQAEDLVFGACPEALVVRTNFYGWGPPYRQSFSDWIIQGLNAGQPLNLFGNVFYTPILIDSLVQHIHELIRLDASGIFNIVGNDRVSKYEFGIAVAKCFGLNADLINLTSMADRQSLVMRPMDMSLSSRKAGKIITHKMNRLSEDIQNLFLKK